MDEGHPISRGAAGRDCNRWDAGTGSAANHQINDVDEFIHIH